MITDPNTSPTLIPTDPNAGGAAFDNTGSGATAGYGDPKDIDDDELGDDFAEDDMDAEDDLDIDEDADLDPSDDDVIEGAPLDDDVEDDLDDDL